MRLPLKLRLLVLTLCAAVPLAGAESQPTCAKDVFVYLDVSKTMRVPRAGGVSRLDIFTRAIGDLLTHTADFVGAGDRVRLVTFSGTFDVPFDEWIEGGVSPRLNAELNRLRALDPNTQDDISKVTDVTLVLRDLQDQLTSGRPAYVILASDLIHDPRNENDANQTERIEAFLQRLRAFQAAVAPENLPQNTIILNANLGGDPDANVGRTISEALSEAPLKARSIPVTGVLAVAQELKRQIGKPVVATVGISSERGGARLGLNLKNPNAFPVRLLQTKVGTQATPADRLIQCGATETITISAPAGSSITAEFNVGKAASADVRDVLDIEMTGARVLLDGLMPFSGLRNETLLLHANVRKILTDDLEVDVHVAGTVTKVPIGKGMGAGSVTFAIPLSPDAAELRGDPTVHVRFSVDNAIALQDGTPSGNVSSDEDKAKTDGDWRDQIPRFIRSLAVFLIAWLLPGQGLVRRIFSASMDANVLDLLPGPERFLNSGTGLVSVFLPTYLLSGGQWTAYVNALPMAVISAMFVFYLLRVAALIVWSRWIEPKGKVLPPKTARHRLDWFSAAIWICTWTTFLGVIFALASLVPNVLVAAT